eukprot:m51a1_g8983 hypothetical protein (579) ;mRNA; f:49733-52286
MELLSAHAAVTFVGIVADVTLAETFHNTTPCETEARPIAGPPFVWRFPLTPGTALYSLTANLDGKSLLAHVALRESASQAYDDAIAGGNRTRCSVEVRFASVCTISVSPRAFAVSLPVAVPGQTSPASLEVDVDASQLALPDSDCLALLGERQTALDSGLKAHSTMQLSSQCPRVGIVSERIPLQGSLIQRASEDSESCFAIAWRAEEREAWWPAEVVVLVDRSGSMGGVRIERARQALLLLIGGLCTGSDYNEESVSTAKQHVAEITANMGGTNIAEPLQAVLESSASSQGVAVFVLTDGHVSNTRQVIRIAEEHCSGGRSRVYALGIGSGADRELIQSLASAGHGRVMESSTSKAGKHGHSKTHIVAVDVVTGKKVEVLQLSSQPVDAASFTQYSVIAVDGDMAEILLDDGTTRSIHVADALGSSVLEEIVDRAQDLVRVNAVTVRGTEEIVSLCTPPGAATQQAALPSTWVTLSEVAKIAYLQELDGSWRPGRRGLADATGLPEGFLSTPPPEAGGVSAVAWCTAVVVAVLHSRHKDNASQWRMMAQKAMRFLDSETPSTANTLKAAVDAFERCS